MGVHTLKLTADVEAALMTQTGEPTPGKALAAYVRKAAKSVPKRAIAKRGVKQSGGASTAKSRTFTTAAAAMKWLES